MDNLGCKGMDTRDSYGRDRLITGWTKHLKNREQMELEKYRQTDPEPVSRNPTRESPISKEIIIK